MADDRAGAAKFLFPKTIRDDRGVWGAGRIVLAGEGAPKHRSNAEQRKRAVGNVKSGETFGFSDAGDADGVPVVDADVLKGLILFAIDKVVGGCHVEVGDVDAGGRVPDANEFVRIRIGKRLEEDAFENAENHRVATDTGSESDERNDGEERSIGQAAEDLLQVT